MSQYNRTYIKIMIDEETKEKLAHLALKKQTNVSKYLLNPFLRHIALAPKLMEQEDRYVQIIKQCLNVLQENTEIMKAVNMLLRLVEHETKAPDRYLIRSNLLRRAAPKAA